jgi:hypothetical protein
MLPSIRGVSIMKELQDQRLAILFGMKNDGFNRLKPFKIVQLKRALLTYFLGSVKENAG